MGTVFHAKQPTVNVSSVQDTGDTLSAYPAIETADPGKSYQSLPKRRTVDLLKDLLRDQPFSNREQPR